MSDPYFFGYGSLVNRQTHGYPNARLAQVQGWRRVWRGTSIRNVAFLSVEPAPGSCLKGLIASVPDADWAVLDLREEAYDRHKVGQIDPPHAALDVQVYAVSPAHLDGGSHPILLSYLDTVIQGYLREYGEAAAVEFFDTTTGWDRPITDDRAAPLYPRATKLTAAEGSVVDANLARIKA